MPERRFFHFTATRADAVLFAALLIAFLLALCARNPLDDSRFAPVHETALSGVVSTGEGRGKIDINAADAALLMELDGIGEVLASRIVEYRAQHGPYRAPRPVPPPVRPGMIEKRQPSNAKFWLAGALCALYALTMPMYDWIHLVPLALVGVGGFFLGRLIFKGKKYYVPVEAEKPKEEEKPKPAPKPEPEPERRASTGNPEVDKIIDEGYGYLKQLREANDRIPDEVMSARISRMEAASADIFAYIAENPEKAPQIRRFMNYYLPTTLRLLTSYEKLSRQRVKGENIQKTMFEIEGMMETIAGAFEKQLDSLFGEDAMDIAADISVMESILKQEGLSDDEDDELPQTKTAARGNRVEQVQAPGGMPTLELDPDAADNGEKKP